MGHATCTTRCLLARRQLNRQSGQKQIIMVTDGEPTAHIEGGEPYFQYPPSPITIEETLKEVMRCTRDGVRINTFMLDESYYLRSFVEQMMKRQRRSCVLHQRRQPRRLRARRLPRPQARTPPRRLSAVAGRGTDAAATRAAPVELVDGGVEAHEAHELDARDRGAHGLDRDPASPRRPGTRRRRC